MILEFKTEIPFRKRTEMEQGEIIKVRDHAGRVVEVWECIGVGSGTVRFFAEGYQNAANI